METNPFVEFSNQVKTVFEKTQTEDVVELLKSGLKVASSYVDSHQDQITKMVDTIKPIILVGILGYSEMMEKLTAAILENEEKLEGLEQDLKPGTTWMLTNAGALLKLKKTADKINPFAQVHDLTTYVRSIYDTTNVAHKPEVMTQHIIDLLEKDTNKFLTSAQKRRIRYEVEDLIDDEKL